MTVELIKSFILGIIEGLTEFVPVSSTGHLIIAEAFMPFRDREFAQAFEVIIQFGAILSVVMLYKDRFIGVFNFSKQGFYGKKAIISLFWTSLPAVVAGTLLHSAVKQYLFNPLTVSFALIAGGIMMAVAEKYCRKGKDGIDSISYRDALVIGLFQVLALFPGMSRSASTISGGLIRGLDVKTSAEYSFIAAVPVMTGAFLYDAFKSREAIFRGDNGILLAAGFITSFVVAAASIKTFMAVLKKTSLKYFALYRIILGVLLISMIVTGLFELNL
ncbi:undecaprenyl-diphosphate phosphatase [candidate division WOR-3 bacterium]|nr:undecaprenyl-diphosphate phosphatase [candidate division WOR-3 bacterium]